MKTLLLSLLLSFCAWSAAAQQSITITFDFTADQWEALTNKVQIVNANLTNKYNAELALWADECVKARTLKQPEPPKPLLTSLTVSDYIRRFAGEQLGTTRQELRAAREQAAADRIRALPPAKLRQVEEYLKTLP